MSTSTNESATESSSGTSLNKRPQNDGGGLASRKTGSRPPQEVSVKRKPKKNPIPYNSGIAKADTYIASLNTGTHNALSEALPSVYEVRKRENNKAFIPTVCRFKLELQPMAAVAKSVGFKNLMRESAEVVEQCQLMLKNEYFKSQWLNVIEYRDNLTSNGSSHSTT